MRYAGKKPPKDMKVYAFTHRMSWESLQELREASEHFNIPSSEIVRRGTQEYLEKLKQESK